MPPSTTSGHAVDAATFAILLHAFESVANEMGINLEQSARSTLIREARDASCALLAADGSIIAQAQHTPVQMASLSLPLRECLRVHGAIGEGEAFFTNDPFAGGQHLQDLMIFVPIIVNGDRLAFAGTIAHHVDIGGGAAGMTPEATEYYQEGLRFTSWKVDLARDLGPRGILRQLVLANFRNPTYALADLQAQFSAATLGVRRFLALVDKYSATTVHAVMQQGIAYSSRLIRERIGALTDGVYEAEDVVEGGFHSNEPIRVRVRLHVDGDEMTLDFSDTDAQVDEFLNVPFGSTLSSCLSALKMALDPQGTIPANEGCSEPVTITALPGSFVNPLPPAATRARMCGAYRIFDAVLEVLYAAGATHIPAQGFHVNTTIGFSHFHEGRHGILIEDIGGGWGAGAEHDGADMQDAPLSNCKITPIEAVEHDHRFVRIVRYAMVPGSGGDGARRGGLGMEREFEVLAEGVRFFAYADRHGRGAAGRAGGCDGMPGAFLLVRDGEERQLPSKCEEPLRIGDRIIVRAGGGAGHGPPGQRSPQRRDRDLRSGRVVPA